MIAATLPQRLATVVHQALLHFFNPLYCLKITFRCINVAGNVLGHMGTQKETLTQYSGAHTV